MDPELTNIVGILVVVAIGAIVVVATVLLVARRRVEQGWQTTQQQRRQLYDRLRNQGVLVLQFIETANHRLTNERQSLEVLGRRQTKVAAGRTPPEKAAATIELNGELERLISIADGDPGLAGLSEYESLREKIEQAVDDIARAAASYNETVDTYNGQASGFFGRLFGALQAERFDASKQGRGARRL
jgi:hypothetical protein